MEASPCEAGGLCPAPHKAAGVSYDRVGVDQAVAIRSSNSLSFFRVRDNLL